MEPLDIAALVVIFLIIVAITAGIVVLGSLPGKIARRRGHPYPDAVNAASWIGLATGVFWPVAFVWAFLPVPGRARAGDGGTDARTEIAELRCRLDALQPAAPAPDAQAVGDAS